jgi:hypothetical protein
LFDQASELVAASAADLFFGFGMQILSDFSHLAGTKAVSISRQDVLGQSRDGPLRGVSNVQRMFSVGRVDRSPVFR